MRPGRRALQLSINALLFPGLVLGFATSVLAATFSPGLFTPMISTVVLASFPVLDSAEQPGSPELQGTGRGSPEFAGKSLATPLAALPQAASTGDAYRQIGATLPLPRKLGAMTLLWCRYDGRDVASLRRIGRRI